ncbi:ABC transporter ATP-binding protein/permease [Erwiniaceae bacterium BAC15a-03b]|uniref:ABC-type xenobiotic transporter n=1 Tax=Winslowiella arboricola TaxID=2978220 RepID=A0A9J6PT85_9GAMM|nr:ABC transporter ATP-binding protein [Winslowiella arboricola]MCU5775499.1 ABC transporter ATP-binding protein/permease [Winslowiella arboricola]MCU5779651.1 ABC transporter ATP-binding protein/permease [Winslowiella arboricola]
MSSPQQVSPLRALLALVSSEKRALRWALMLAALSVLLELIPYTILWLAVDRLAEDRLLPLAGWLALALVLKTLLLLLAGYFSHLAAFRLLYQLRLRIARALTRLPLMQLAPYSSGSLRKIIINDVERLESFIAHHSVDLIAALVSPLTAALFLFWLDWKMALAALITVPLAIAAQKLFSRGMAERTRAYHQATGQLNGAITEFVRGIPVMKAYRQTAQSFRLLHNSLTQYHQLVEGFTRRAVPSWSLFVVLLNANIFILLPLGIWRISAGTLTISELVLILMLGSGLLKPLLRVTFLGTLMREILAGMARIQPFLASEPARESDQKAPAGRELIAENLSFGYEGRDVVTDVSLLLHPGDFCALVGPSGAGKSTLAWLLAGLLPPDKGEVRIGDTPLNQLDDSTRAALLAVVSQDVFLFKGTLADNLRIGNPQATDGQIAAALTIAQAQAFVSALPQGIETPLHERGLRLSGGERQRIAIARALLADTPVLILDEATAFADALTEAAFYQALRRARPQTCVLTIAHRLFAVQQADVLLLMDQGHLVASGTHQQLMADNALYQRLWHSQYQLQHWHIRSQECTDVDA